MTLNPETLSVVANLTSTAVALAALGLAFLAERHNRRRFDEELELTRTVASASVRPILALELTDDDDDKKMELWNHGGGPAVIRKISFKRGNRTAKGVRDLVELGHESPFWSDYTDAPSGTWYLRPNTADTLLQLTRDRLHDDHVGDRVASLMLEELSEQLSQVRAFVTYEDVLGNVIGQDKELPE
jgi:hypothetical protein